MKELWADGDYVVACNPNGSSSTGRSAVIEGCERLFGAGGTISIRMTDEQVQVGDRFAWVFGKEVYHGRYAAEENRPDDIADFFATNLFEKDGDEWKIVHHIALPIRDDPDRLAGD